MHLMSETVPNRLHVGSVCENQSNQVFTVIGFVEKSLRDMKSKPAELDYGLDFDPTGDKKYVYGLYFDVNSPERQEVIDCQAIKVKFVRDISENQAYLSAINSPFNNAEVVKHLVGILDGKIKCKNQYSASILRNYIIRGFDSMIRSLHSQYVAFLATNGLSKDLLACIVKGACESLTDKNEKKSIAQTEIKLDLLRQKALSSVQSLKARLP